MNRCPTCDSPAPYLHPATGFEGEVELCTHNFHLNANAAEHAKIHRRRDRKTATLRLNVEAAVKLTDEQAARARRMRRDGWDWSEIAERLGVETGT